MSKQPVVFNVTYTPYKLPSNAPLNKVEKNIKERAFYDMSGENNIYKYMTTDGKVCGKETDKFTILQYFEKTTGVFNDKGIISKEELTRMKRDAQIGYKNLWHGFISFDEEHSEQIDSVDKCIKVVKDTFNDFFNDSGFKPENMDLICSLHIDRPKHLHIHFLFYEKEPIVKNQRGAGYKYRAKGKIPKEAITNMLNRLNNLSLKTEYKSWKEEQLAFEKQQAIRHMKEYIYANEKDILFERIKELAKVLPHRANLNYNEYEIKEHRTLIDAVVGLLAIQNQEVGKNYFKFINKVEDRKRELKEKANLKAREEFEKLEEIERNFKSELGNLVLKKVFYIQCQHRPRKKEYKVNDKGLKRQIRIEESKVNKSLNSLITSFGQSVLFALNYGENEYSKTKSAVDIEKEMIEETKKQKQQQEYEEYLKEQQLKEYYNSYSK